MIKPPPVLLILIMTGFVAWACLNDREGGLLDQIPVEVTLLKLEPPSLIGPNDGRFIWSGNSVLMRWRPVLGADSYQLDLSNDPIFSTLKVSAILDSTSVRSGPLTAGTYYWRVQARMGLQAKSLWSDRRHFWLKERD